MKEKENFLYFCNKLKERLIVVLDHNIKNGIDLSEGDEYFLREMHFQYVMNERLAYLCKPDTEEEVVTEQQLFPVIG